jgi:hypothetical protein
MALHQQARTNPGQFISKASFKIEVKLSILSQSLTFHDTSHEVIVHVSKMIQHWPIIIDHRGREDTSKDHVMNLPMHLSKSIINNRPPQDGTRSAYGCHPPFTPTNPLSIVKHNYRINIVTRPK